MYYRPNPVFLLDFGAAMAKVLETTTTRSSSAGNTAVGSIAIPDVVVSSSLPSALAAKRKARAVVRIQDALDACGALHISADVLARAQEIVVQWAAVGYADGFSLIEEFELECFQAREISSLEGAAQYRQEHAHLYAIGLEFGKIEIRGLQMSARVYQDLETTYVPLSVQVSPNPSSGLSKAGHLLDPQNVPKSNLLDLLAEHRTVLLLGAPGSGKSTTVAYLAARAAGRRLPHGLGSGLVPFVVTARSLGRAKIDPESIAASSPVCSVEFVRAMLEAKRALLLVDGLDEAQEGQIALRRSLTRFRSKFPGNFVLLTSRPSTSVVSRDLELSGYTTAILEPMTRDDVYTFIDRWCLAAELSIQKDRPRAEGDAGRAAEDLKDRVKRSRPIERLAQTPLLCSVLCIVHRFLGQRVPERRTALYEACTNVLLYEWDRAKFSSGSVVGRFDAHAKRFLLSQLARFMHENGLSEVRRDVVVDCLRLALPLIGGDPVDADRIVAEIQTRSGMLVEQRDQIYSFSHLTFQEYLTAVAFVHAGESRALGLKMQDPFWHEVIPLAAGLPGADVGGLIRQLLRPNSDVKYRATGVFLAARCVETAIDLSVSLRQRVEKQLQMFVPPRSASDRRRLSELGIIAGPVLLRALEQGAAVGRAECALALGLIGYEPACPALLRLAENCEAISESIVAPFGNTRIHFEREATIGDMAIVALFNGAIKSPLMAQAFEHSLRYASDRVLAWFEFAVEGNRVFLDSIGVSAAGLIAASGAASKIKRSLRTRAKGTRGLNHE